MSFVLGGFSEQKEDKSLVNVRNQFTFPLETLEDVPIFPPNNYVFLTRRPRWPILSDFVNVNIYVTISPEILPLPLFLSPKNTEGDLSIKEKCQIKIALFCEIM